GDDRRGRKPLFAVLPRLFRHSCRSALDRLWNAGLGRTSVPVLDALRPKIRAYGRERAFRCPRASPTGAGAQALLSGAAVQQPNRRDLDQPWTEMTPISKLRVGRRRGGEDADPASFRTQCPSLAFESLYMINAGADLAALHLNCSRERR